MALLNKQVLELPLSIHQDKFAGKQTALRGRKNRPVEHLTVDLWQIDFYFKVLHNYVFQQLERLKKRNPLEPCQ